MDELENAEMCNSGLENEKSKVVGDIREDY